MKKIFSGLICGAIFYSAIVSNAKAQVSLASMTSSKTTVIPALAVVSEDKTPGVEKTGVNKGNSKANLKAMKANFKALENFTKEFKNVPDAKWQVEEQVISAVFNRDDIQTRVIYDKRGRWVHTIAYCGESKMPKEIRSLVRSNYPDYNITGMNEIKEGYMTFYIIYLEDEAGYKQICLHDGELNVYQEFTKQ